MLDDWLLFCLETSLWFLDLMMVVFSEESLLNGYTGINKIDSVKTCYLVFVMFKTWNLSIRRNHSSVVLQAHIIFGCHRYSMEPTSMPLQITVVSL